MFARFIAVASVLLLGVRSCDAQSNYYEVVATSTAGYRFNGSSFNPTITLIKGQTYGETPVNKNPLGRARASHPARDCA